MYEFHGWLRSDSQEDIAELRDNAPGDDYDPMFVGYVNGTIHVHFSGNPNRDRGELKDILEYFLDGTYKFNGLVYINDSDGEFFDKYKVLKIFDDTITETGDPIFTSYETDLLFR